MRRSRSSRRQRVSTSASTVHCPLLSEAFRAIRLVRSRTNIRDEENPALSKSRGADELVVGPLRHLRLLTVGERLDRALQSFCEAGKGRQGRCNSPGSSRREKSTLDVCEDRSSLPRRVSSIGP